MSELRSIIEHERRAAPAETPQALAWHNGELWVGSRDLSRMYVIDPEKWTVRKDFAVPGIPWAAVSVGDALWFTLGEGEKDDRFIHYYLPGKDFGEREPIVCPEFTGSYLSHDGKFLYLSQWYKGRILRLDDNGEILRTFEVRLEVSGHVWIPPYFYVLRGTEADESWRIARFDPEEPVPNVVDVAKVPFACRSLTFDGELLWSNHRQENQIVSFSIPNLRDLSAPFTPAGDA